MVQCRSCSLVPAFNQDLLSSSDTHTNAHTYTHTHIRDHTYTPGNTTGPKLLIHINVPKKRILKSLWVILINGFRNTRKIFQEYFNLKNLWIYRNHCFYDMYQFYIHGRANSILAGGGGGKIVHPSHNSFIPI